MDVLKIENNYSWLISGNNDLKQILWKSMRHQTRGARYNARYVSRAWDGYTEFFKKGTGRFLTGLLPEVKAALKHFEIQYTIQDLREPFEFAIPSVDENWLATDTAPIILRDYQVDYINQTIRNHRGIIPSPTSSGKTSIMIGILKALPLKTPTLVLANRVDLVEQNYDEIKKYGVQNVGRFYGGKKEPNYITCCTVQSAHLLQSILPKIRVIMVDEIHEMMSKQSKEVYKLLTGTAVRIGMSATWEKFGGKDHVQRYEVKGWIGPEFSSKRTESGKITTKELQDRNILSQATCSFFEVNEPQLPYEIYLDAVTKGIAENEHMHAMVKRLVGKLSGRTLIIVERIAHGDRLQEIIPNSLWVRGKDTTETRKEIIAKLKTDENIVAIATSGIFNTGINVFVHHLVNCAGGQADHQIIQRFGRGLRVASDKDHLNYYDFYFAINDYLERHSRKRIKILEKQGHTVKVYPDIE